jgi:hypothetical protein
MAANNYKLAFLGWTETVGGGTTVDDKRIQKLVFADVFPEFFECVRINAAGILVMEAER